jgi:hypothetical protein
MAEARLFLSASAVFLLAFAPQPADACSFTPRQSGDAERHAREVFERSSAILDAVVEMPQAGALPARLRPIRILKGPNLPLFLIVPGGSCGVHLRNRGERVRLVLAEGPELFDANLWDNGLDFSDGRGSRRFEAELDRLVGVPRPAGTAGLNAEEPPPR